MCDIDVTVWKKRMAMPDLMSSNPMLIIHDKCCLIYVKQNTNPHQILFIPEKKQHLWYKIVHNKLVYHDKVQHINLIQPIFLKNGVKFMSYKIITDIINNKASFADKCLCI